MNRSRNSNNTSGSYSSSPSGLPNSANRNFNNLNRNDAYRSDYQPKYGTNQQSHDDHTGERYDNVHYGEHREEQNQNTSMNSYRNQQNPQFSDSNNYRAGNSYNTNPDYNRGSHSYGPSRTQGMDRNYGETDHFAGQEGNASRQNVGRYAGQNDQQYPATERFGSRENPSEWQGNPSTRSSYGADWNLSESHAGRGPKNYKRSDERIQEDVSEALTHAHHVDATEIDVDVKEGIVTLSGTVNDKKTKRWAEELIENLSGVKDVKNNISVSAQTSQSNTETDKSTKRPTSSASKLQ